MKKRIRYFDLLRVISFACIVYYHMVVQLHLSDYWSIDFVSPLYENANMHIATLSVAIFFMLSGASLMYTTTRQSAGREQPEKLQIGSFYRKRFLRLLIPYYVTWLLYIVFRLVTEHGNWSGIFPPGIPKWRFVYTLLGLDEWIGMHGVVTFSAGIGEWFLGALLILYLVFPLLRTLVLKKPRITLAAASVLYFLLLWKNPFPVNNYMNLMFKGYEFLLGMYLGIYWQRIRPGWYAVSIPVMLFFIFSPVALPLSETLKITVMAAACFVTFSLFEHLPESCTMGAVQALSNVSYEIFLVHHLVIYAVLDRFPPQKGRPETFVLVFFLQVVGMAAAGLVVKAVSGLVLRYLPGRKS